MAGRSSLAGRLFLIYLLAVFAQMQCALANGSEEVVAEGAAAAAAPAAADGAASTSVPPTAPLTSAELRKLRIPALKEMLAARGQVCEGCAEKHDFIKLVEETQHLPLVEKPAAAAAATGSAAPTGAPTDKPTADPGFDVEALLRKYNLGGRLSPKFQRIKKRLEKKGIDTSKINFNQFSGPGFDNLDDKTLENLFTSFAGPQANAAADTESEGARVKRPAASAAQDADTEQAVVHDEL